MTTFSLLFLTIQRSIHTHMLGMNHETGQTLSADHQPRLLCGGLPSRMRLSPDPKSWKAPKFTTASPFLKASSTRMATSPDEKFDTFSKALNNSTGRTTLALPHLQHEWKPGGFYSTSLLFSTGTHNKLMSRPLSYMAYFQTTRCSIWSNQ